MDWRTTGRPRWRPLILPAFENKATLFELTRINYVAGAVYAKAAQALFAKTGMDPSEVLCIGVDGQTLYQEPPDRPRIASDGAGRRPRRLVARRAVRLRHVHRRIRRHRGAHGCPHRHALPRQATTPSVAPAHR